MALAGGGTVLAWLGRGHAWLTTIAALVVAAAWVWIELKSGREHRIITQGLRYGQGHILLNDVDQELERQRASRELISVDHVWPQAPGHRYTTPAMIEWSGAFFPPS